MKSILLLASLLSITIALRAQQAMSYKVKSGEIVMQVIPIEQRYRYSTFQSGMIYFINGKSLPAQLNYNLLYGEMEFIDAKGDTLALYNALSVKNIVIGENVFYYQYGNGYFEGVAKYASLILSKKELIKVIRSEEPIENGYDQHSSELVSIDRYNKSIHSLNYRKLYTQKSKGDLLLIKEVSFVLIDKNNRFHLAKRGSLLKLFPRYKKAVDKYMRENKPNFKREQDLKMLLEFCSQLAAK